MRHRPTRWIPPVLMAVGMCAAAIACAGSAAAGSRESLTVTRPRPLNVPSPLLPGAPIPYSGSPLLTPLDLSVVDGRTRFLTPGPAQDRCPGDHIVFVPGVVNPFRPTVAGDGAVMCRGDAVAEGFIGP